MNDPALDKKLPAASDPYIRYRKCMTEPTLILEREYPTLKFEELGINWTDLDYRIFDQIRVTELVNNKQNYLLAVISATDKDSVWLSWKTAHCVDLAVKKRANFILLLDKSEHRVNCSLQLVVGLILKYGGKVFHSEADVVDYINKVERIKNEKLKLEHVQRSNDGGPDASSSLQHDQRNS